MRRVFPGLIIAASATLTLAQDRPFDRDGLRSSINTDDLLADAQTLEDFAYSTTERNRVFGSPGHNATVNWLYDELSSLNGYYSVSLQPFVALFSEGDASFTVNGADQSANLLTYTPSGVVPDTSLIAIPNLGCNATDYPSEVKGRIALISRGVCPFGLKSALAGSAGAAGAVIYNNVPGNLTGTLGAESNPEGPYAPTVGIPLSNGQALLALLNSTTSPVIGNLEVNAILENRTTYNVIADSKSGNLSSVLTIGAHTDSVSAGPGINDNGSGTIGILAVARALSRFPVLPATYNSIRFAFWSAEEFGLLGSRYYVANLAASELAKIKLYLNFDMIASPNYIYSIYDGDGSAFNLTGPPGSAQAEALFQSYYDTVDVNYTASPFNGRSDYAPFIETSIPAGGLFTGAEQIKTDQEAAIFGGQAGIAYDPNYHGPGDTVENLNLVPFDINTRAIAWAVATYLESFNSIPDRPPNGTAAARRTKRTSSGSSGGSGGSGGSSSSSSNTLADGVAIPKRAAGLVDRLGGGGSGDGHTHASGGCAKFRLEV